MKELIKYLIVSGTVIALGVIAVIYQLIKKGFFRITVQVEEDQEKKGIVEIEDTDKRDYENFMGKKLYVQYQKNLKKVDTLDINKVHVGRLKSSLAKRVLEDIPPDYVD